MLESFADVVEIRQIRAFACQIDPTEDLDGLTVSIAPQI